MTINAAEIKRIAIGLFEKLSFAKTSVADIAKACGLGKGTLYLHFGSKDEILVSIARDRLEEIGARKRAWFLEPGVSRNEKMEEVASIAVDEFVYLKDILFGDYEDMSGRGLKEVFSRVQSLKEWARELLLGIARGEKSLDPGTEERLRLGVDEFLDLVIGSMINYVLGNEWNDKPGLKAQTVRRAPKLFAAFVEAALGDQAPRS